MRIEIKFEIEVPDVKHTSQELSEYLLNIFNREKPDLDNVFEQESEVIPKPIAGTFSYIKK